MNSYERRRRRRRERYALEPAYREHVLAQQRARYAGVGRDSLDNFGAVTLLDELGRRAARLGVAPGWREPWDAAIERIDATLAALAASINATAKKR
jgi:hypothetical protein